MTAFTKDIIKSCIQVVAETIWKIETKAESDRRVHALMQERFAMAGGEELTKEMRKYIIKEVRLESTNKKEFPDTWNTFYGGIVSDEGTQLQQECTSLATRFMEAVVWDSAESEDPIVTWKSIAREVGIRGMSRLMNCGAIEIEDGLNSDVDTQEMELSFPHVGSLLDSALRLDTIKHLARETGDYERLKPMHKKGGKLGKVAKKTEKNLRDVKFKVNAWMFAQIHSIWDKIKRDKFITKEGKEVSYAQSYTYVMKGAANTLFCEELHSTWSFDAQLRMYMDAHHGAYCQSGSFQRSLFMYKEPVIVTKGSEGHRQLMLEMSDMSFKMSPEIKDLMRLHEEEGIAKGLNRLLYKELLPQCFDVVEAGADWMVKQVKMKDKKAFISYLAAHQFMEIHNEGEAWVTISAGLDAKCSGAQYLGIAAGSKKIATLCGMTTKSQMELGNITIRGKSMPLDPYTNALAFFRGLSMLGRGEIKTPFMAKQYEGTWNAMYEGKLFNFGGICEKMKFEPSTSYSTEFWKGHAEASSRAWLMNERGDNAGKQEAMHMEFAIDDSFGKEIKELKRWLKDVGLTLAVTNNKVSYRMTDGEVISYQKFFKTHWESEIHSEFLGFTETTANTMTRFISHKIETKVLDYDKMGRDMVVSWVQATDALVMRTMVNEANKLDIHNVSPIHDCIRFDVNNAHMCKTVCANAYRITFVDNKQVQNLVDQFGTKPFCPNYDMNISEAVLKAGFYFCK